VARDTRKASKASAYAPRHPVKEQKFRIAQLGTTERALGVSTETDRPEGSEEPGQPHRCPGSPSRMDYQMPKEQT